MEVQGLSRKYFLCLGYIGVPKKKWQIQSSIKFVNKNVKDYLMTFYCRTKLNLQLVYKVISQKTITSNQTSSSKNTKWTGKDILYGKKNTDAGE